MNNLNFKRWKR